MVSENDGEGGAKKGQGERKRQIEREEMLRGVSPPVRFLFFFFFCRSTRNESEEGGERKGGGDDWGDVCGRRGRGTGSPHGRDDDPGGGGGKILSPPSSSSGREARGQESRREFTHVVGRRKAVGKHQPPGGARVYFSNKKSLRPGGGRGWMKKRASEGQMKQTGKSFSSLLDKDEVK